MKHETKSRISQDALDQIRQQNSAGGADNSEAPDQPKQTSSGDKTGDARV